jgi:hypothetical protein
MATTLCHEAGLRQRLGSNARQLSRVPAGLRSSRRCSGAATRPLSWWRLRRWNLNSSPRPAVGTSWTHPRLHDQRCLRAVAREPLATWFGVLRRTTRPRGAVGEARDPTLDVSRETSSLAGAASIEMTPARPGDHRASAQDGRRSCEHGPDPPPPHWPRAWLCGGGRSRNQEARPGIVAADTLPRVAVWIA